MSPMIPLTISPLLREVAELRIEEFGSAKSSFESRYHHNPEHAVERDQVKRILRLLQDIKTLDPELKFYDEESKLATTTRYLEQAQHDASIQNRVLKYEADVWKIIDKHSARLNIAALHIDLMKEAMDADKTLAANLQATAVDDDFEVIENELEGIMEAFEHNTLTTKDVDAEAIEAYLSSIFHDNRTAQEVLQQVQTAMQNYGDQLLEDRLDMEQDHLMWVLMDIMQDTRIDVTKKKTLANYLQAPIALRELAEVFTMRSFRHWNYKNAEKGLPVVVSKSTDCKYDVTVEEDLLDMIFLRCTAVGWASKFRKALKQTNLFTRPFSSTPEVSKRDCYLANTYNPFLPCGISIPPPPPPCPIDCGMPPPMPMMPSKKTSRMKKSRRRCASPPPPPTPPRFRIPCPPRAPPAFLDEQIFQDYFKTFFMWRLPSLNGTVVRTPSAADIQAQLIRTLAFEGKMYAAFNGNVEIYAPSFESLASSLPHKTIITVLKFFGVPELFLDFFTRFLEVNLDLGSLTPEGSGKVVKRACGLSADHGLATFFSEAILMFLETSVYQKTGRYLYRLRDKCYLVGSKAECRAAEAATIEFANIMGLKLVPQSESHELRIGLLVWDTGSNMFKIDNAEVTALAHSVKKQLEASATALEWIRVWNNTVGTYAAHHFGPLSEVFGQAHLDAIKATYKQIYMIIFDGGDLASYVRTMLKQRTQIALPDSPSVFEALIYLPEAYGGLGIKNPFITLTLAGKMQEDPDALFSEYLASEDAYYAKAKATWDAQSVTAKQQQLIPFFGSIVDFNTAEGQARYTFPSQAEVMAHRTYAALPVLPLDNNTINSNNNSTFGIPPPPMMTPFPRSGPVNPLYLHHRLLNESTNPIEHSPKVGECIDELSSFGDKREWDELSQEDRWVLQMYSEECFEHFGTLNIWWENGVPTAVYKALRGCVWDDGEGGDGGSDAASDITDV